MKLGHKANLLVAILLSFELIFVGSLYSLFAQAEDDARRIDESREIVTCINRLMRTIVSLSLRIRSLTLTTDKETMALIRAMYSQLYDLEKACENHPREKQAVMKVRLTVDDGMSEFANAQEMIKSGQWDEVTDYMDKVKPLLLEMTQRFEDIRRDQENIERSSFGRQVKQRAQIKNLLISGLGINIALALFLVSLFNKGIAYRLRHLMRNTQKLSQGAQLEPPIPGNDEIAHLDKIFNDVATALTIAMNKQNAILQHALEVICSLDENNTFMEVSTSALRVLGYEPQELIGMRFFDILVADEVGPVKQIFNELVEGNPECEFESKVRKKGGPIITVLFAASWSKDEKTIFLAALDITERKQQQEILEEAERNLRNIIESLPIGLLMSNLRGVIKLSNPVAERMLSQARKDLSERPIKEFIQVPGQEDVLDFIEKCEGRALETPVIVADGKSFTAEISAKTVSTVEGQRLLILIVDVSERAEIERMKQQFVAMVSHELRTPLMSVQVYLELLERGTYGSLNETGAQKLKAVDDNLTRLTKLIKDLLDVERLESGTLSSRKRPVVLSDIFEMTKEGVLAASEKNKIHVQFSSEEISFHADPDRLVQVLVNLIANAIKFSPAQSTVHVEGVDEGNSVRLSVKDEGRGVPAEFREKIFERFQQVSIDDASKKGGAGLGLAICKSIVHQHGGTIAVESEEGKGSTFWLSIPKE